MARQEHDREDLFAEATALVRRAEIVGRGHREPLTVGFRRDGGWSIYFGSDPAYHFDADGRLKRAFHSGRLFRTQGDTLAELTRERTATKTILHRRDLTPRELEPFLAQMHGRITNSIVQRKYDDVRITRQVPEHDDAFWSDFEAAVARMNSHRSITDQLAPRFKGKR